VKDASGNLIAQVNDYVFSRYGFAADWSPDGEYVAFAGRNGQCPYGLIVARNDLAPVYGPANAPFVCDPSYSPDGRWLAFAGIQTRPGVDDGRLDLFIAQPNGYGARNLTSGLRGEVRLVGWVGE
jgi:Tol biopolymer transport system component